MSNRDRNEKELETVNASVSEKETEAKGRVKRDKKDSIPVGEDKSRRKENIKQLRMTDGSWLAATYPYAVHYEESGAWIEIDNRLEEKE